MNSVTHGCSHMVTSNLFLKPIIIRSCIRDPCVEASTSVLPFKMCCGQCHCNLCTQRSHHYMLGGKPGISLSLVNSDKYLSWAVYDNTSIQIYIVNVTNQGYSCTLCKKSCLTDFLLLSFSGSLDIAVSQEVAQYFKQCSSFIHNECVWLYFENVKRDTYKNVTIKSEKCIT